MLNPSDWMQLSFNDVSQPEISPTTTTTTTTTTTATTVASGNYNLSLDQGRGARPIRRRSRASRRTPTTLLNTDTTNFRAMVQQFTGSPNTTSAARSHLSSATGMFDFAQHIASTAPSVPPASGFHPVQYPNHMQRQHMFMVDNMHGGGGGGGVQSRAPPASSPPNENRDYDNYMF